MTVTQDPPVETRPARERPGPKWIIIGAGVAVAVAAAVYVGGWTSVMGVQEVRVEGAQGASAQEIVNTAGIEEGTPLMRVDVRAATARLSDLPQVAAVDVRREWPRRVVIDVTPREAVAVLRTGERWELLDANGVAFAVAPQKPKNLPVIELSADQADEAGVGEAGTDSGVGEPGTDAGVGDPSTDNAVNEEALTTAMLKALAAMSPTVRDAVATVTAPSPTSIRLTLRKGGAVVNWGSAERSDYKSQVLEILLEVEAGWYDVSNPDTPTTAAAPPQPRPLPAATDDTASSSEIPSAPATASPSPAVSTPAVTPSPVPTPSATPTAAEAPVGVVPQAD